MSAAPGHANSTGACGVDAHITVPTHVDSYPLDGLALGILLLLIVFPVVQE